MNAKAVLSLEIEVLYRLIGLRVILPAFIIRHPSGCQRITGWKNHRLEKAQHYSAGNKDIVIPIHYHRSEYIEYSTKKQSEKAKQSGTK